MKKLWLAALMVAAGLNLAAENFKTQSVSIFKDGSVFFRKKGLVNVKDKHVLLSTLDIATPNSTPAHSLAGFWETELRHVLFGSLWFYAPDNALVSTSRYDRQVESFQPISDLKTLIRANVGKEVTFYFKNDTIPVFAKSYTLEGDFLILETAKKWIPAQLSQVEKIEFLARPVATAAIAGSQRFIRLDFQTSRANQPFEIIYMQRGITWIPNYLVKLDGKGKADITLRATVINELEDLEDVEMNFVVGVPSYQHRETPSPFTSNQNIASFFNSLLGKPSPMGRMNSGISQGVMTNSIDPSLITNYSTTSNSTNPQVLEFVPEGSTQEDLYFFQFPSLTLPNGGRAFCDLLHTETTYKAQYYCSLPINGSASAQNFPVYSSISLKNNSGKPFTTGSVLICLEEGGNIRPVSESQLSFTPSGLSTQIKNTKAPDVSVEWREEATSLADGDLRRYQVSVRQGTIEITNLKGQPIDLEIDKTIVGILDESNTKWETHEHISGGKNKTNTVKWDLKIGAGDRKVITYEYKFYQNRN